jgi:iron complex outermembrane receptor protein
LLLKPFEGFENSTIFTYHYDKTRNSPGAGYNNEGLGTFDPALDIYESPYFKTRRLDTTLNLDKPSYQAFAAINTTSYEINDQLTIKNIFGYVHSVGNTNDATDNDGTFVNALDLLLPARRRRNYQTTDEAQLQGRSFGGRLTWIVGGLLDQTREPGGLDTINIVSVIGSTGAFTQRFQQNTINSYAAFGSATLKLLDGLNLSAGFRHSWDHVASLQGAYPGTDGVIPPDSGALSSLASKFQGNTYNAELDYHPTSKLMIYGGYRRGYKHGGFNASVTDPALRSYAPETVDDFHLGLKDDFILGNVPGRFNIEGYYDRYQGQQVSYLSGVFIGGNFVLVAPTVNVPRTRYTGLDADFTIDPTHWLSLNASYSFLDAKNTRWIDDTVPGQTADLTINPVSFSPRNKLSITGRLHTELPGGQGEIAFAPSYNYQSLYYTTPLAVQLPLAEAALFGQFNMAAHGGAQVPAYSTIDLRFEWNHLLGSRFDAAVNVTNLTNRIYFTGNAGTLQIGFDDEGYGPPRMITFEVSAHF